MEGEVGRFRRRWLTPVPACDTFEDLNDYLLDCCIADLDRTIGGRGETIGDAAARERTALRRLPREAYDVSEIAQCRVDAKCRVTVRTNRYSVPARLVGRVVAVRLTPLAVEISHAGQVVATHPRLHLKWGEHLEIDHYRNCAGSVPARSPAHCPCIRNGTADASEPTTKRCSRRFVAVTVAPQELAR